MSMEQLRQKMITVVNGVRTIPRGWLLLGAALTAWGLFASVWGLGAALVNLF